MSPEGEKAALEVTRLLRAIEAGDEAAKDELFSALDGQLRWMAAVAMHGQAPGHTLQPTALVNEAYLRVMRASGSSFVDRQHFFRSAAVAMRHLLVDHARKKRSDKRDGSTLPVALDTVIDIFELRSRNLEELDDVLTAFSRVDPVMAEAIDLKFFAGMPEVEVAETLGMTLRTFQRRWRATRSYLRAQLDPS